MMHPPAILMVILFSFGLAVAAHRHGQQERASFWLVLIATAVQSLILWWGGFWK
jgi:hypothetical protein